MNFPTSNIEEVQRRINRAKEIFETQTEEEIFWMRYQAALTTANRERRGDNQSFKAVSNDLKKD